MIAELVAGALVTLQLLVIAWSVGFPLGVATAIVCFRAPLLRTVWRPIGIGAATVPLLAVLFWVHYPLQQALGVVWSPFLAASIALTFMVFSLSTSLVIEAMDRANEEFADVVTVLGIPPKAYLARALVPTALFVSIPRLLSLVIVTIHSTMFASLIGVEELFRVVLRLNAQYLKPVELFTAMAAAYALLCLPMYLVANRFESRIKRYWSRA